MKQKFINFVGPQTHFYERCGIPEEINLREIVLMLLRGERSRIQGKDIKSRGPLPGEWIRR